MNPHITLLDDHPLPPATPIEWKQAAADVHVATRGGEFAGFVSFEGGAHLAHDAHGRAVGAHATFAEAQAALAAAVAGRSVVKGHGSASRRPYARRRMRRALA